MRGIGRVLGLLVIVCVCSAGTVWGYTISINLTAEVVGVDDMAGLLEGQIGPGDTITGTYTFDSTTADTSPASTIGQYPHYTPPYGVVLYGGGFVFQTDPDNVDFNIGILNDNQGSDAYAWGSRSNLPLSNGASV